MINRNLKWVLLLLLLTDAVYSFYQHYQMPLDGDLTKIVLPVKEYKKVLDDPFGLSVLLKGESYFAPNRFFAHATMVVYFKNVPLFLQKFVNPIDSIYLSCAIAKMGIQLFLIWLLARYISGTKNIFRKDFLVAAILMMPLFQTNGYNVLMGIIDKSITYTFFYALPLSLLLLFFLPFYKSWWERKPLNFNVFTKIGLILLTVFLAFNGPLVSGVVLIVCPSALLYLFWKEFKTLPESGIFNNAIISISKIQRSVLFYFLFFSAICFYSLLIGRYNAENVISKYSLWQQYLRMPIGFYLQFIQKLAFPVLMLAIFLNAVFIKKQKSDPKAERIWTVLKVLAIFCLVYSLLLPLGGYRDYRQYVIRRDTMLPITLSMMFWFGLSSFYLLKNISPKYKRKYIAGLIGFVLIFTLADEPGSDKNFCEKNALKTIANSPEKVVPLNCDCTILAWRKTTIPSNSDINTWMLKHWNVTKHKKRYFQK